MPMLRRAFITVATVQAVDLGAGAARVGTALTNVLRWAPVPAASNADITVVDSATNGMSFVLNQPGIYQAEINLGSVVATTLVVGLSLNVTPAGAPNMATAGILASSGPVISVAAQTLSVFVRRTIRIASSAVGAVLRTMATDGAGATPNGVSSVVAGVNWFVLTRTHDAG